MQPDDRPIRSALDSPQSRCQEPIPIEVWILREHGCEVVRDDEAVTRQLAITRAIVL